MRTSYIYKITNPVGQIYIGQTINYEERKGKYKRSSCKSQKLIYNSIKKYTFEKHKIEIIYKSYCSQEILNKLEVFFIESFNSWWYSNKVYGLNLTKGGELSRLDIKHTDESKDKIKKSFTKERRDTISKRMKERIVTVETRQKLSIINKGRVIKNRADIRGEDSPHTILTNDIVYNIKLDIYVGIKRKDIITKYSITENIYNSIKLGYCWKYINLSEDDIKKYRQVIPKIYQYNKDGKFIKEWNSAKEVSKSLKINITQIKNCCEYKNNYISVSGFKWSYLLILDGTHKSIRKNRKNRPENYKTIIQYDKNMNFIKEWDSIKNASTELKISRCSISNSCRGLIKRPQKFIFRYKELAE